MASFSFEALDGTGKAQKGTLEASSQAEVTEILKGQGLHPVNIQMQTPGGAKAGAAGGAKAGAAVAAKPGAKGAKAAAKPAAEVNVRQRTFTIGKGVSQKALTAFTRQFSTLIEAGLPVVRALDIMEQMVPPSGLRNCIMDVRDEVEQGSSLSEAMEKNPAAFDDLYVSMIRAGEMGGMLGQILNRLADFREKSQKLKRQIVGALIYPTVVVFVAAVILTLLIIFIIPQFKDMFEEMGLELPAPTQILLSITDVMVEYWYLVPFVPIGLVVLLAAFRKTYFGRRLTDLILLYLPVFGIIVRKSTISRFCRTLGELSSAGVPILDALGILKTAVGNLVVSEAVIDIHAAIREGESIADPMARSGVFDMIVVNMVEVGEETGELDRMLIRVADNYDNEVDVLVGSMMSLLEPFLIVGMGCAVGFIVIALFIPLISIMENLGN